MLFVATAGLLTACSSDDDNTIGGDVQAPAETPRLITVEVSEQPFDDTQGKARQTRADATTTETLSSFSMHGVYESQSTDYTVSKSGDTWTVDPNSWPGGTDNNGETPFYAHTHGTFNLNSGTPYVRFMIQENASDQYDLLVAQNSATYNNSKGTGNVSLRFKHACAAVAFNVQITNTLSGKLTNGTLTVNSIVLRNVYNDGKYYFGSGWQDVNYEKVNGQEKKANYTLSNSNITVGTGLQALSSNDIFIIPQERIANGTNDMYLEIKYSGKTEPAIIPLDVDWQAGYKYTIDIKLGTSLINV